jgi:hypothetical protein
VDYPGERTSKAFFYYADHKMPDVVNALKGAGSVSQWLARDASRPHLLLLTSPSQKKAPLLWRALANSHRGAVFGHVPDVAQTASKLLGETIDGEKSLVLVYGLGAEKPVRYTGELKLKPLKKFVKEVVAGTADVLQSSGTGTDAPAPEADPKHEEL